MKNIIKKNTVFLLAAALFITSCSDWLDVAPDNQVNENELFSTGDGYRNALNGIYVNLSTSSLYGAEMTWGFMDVLGQIYQSKKMASSHTYAKAAEYKYDDSSVKSVISNFWSVSYNNISNCNNLIRNASVADPLLFTEGEMEKNMIWGEALALRAFMHFDILRMFAPSMEKDDYKAYIPYLDVYPSISTAYETNAEILKKIEADLKKAKDLLATCDTIEGHKEWMTTGVRMLGEGTTTSVSEDVFLAYRGFRMNYYAITAMLARVYSWEGRYEDAYKQAQEVIDATSDDDREEFCFDFEKSTGILSNLKDYNSIIMAFSRDKLTEEYEAYTTGGNTTKLMIDAETIFEGSKEDVRGIDLVGTLGSSKYSLKYTIKKGGKGTDMIPVIRLSEMYYIVGEHYAHSNDFKKSGEMLDKVRSARGIISKSLKISSLDEFKTELLKEVRKEFVGEGQLFFQYKRLDKKPVVSANFIFSRPDNEDV